MKCYHIIQKLEELSPKSYALEWDNIGLLVGRKEKEVKKILVALDATDEVIQNAVELGADMLVTHHPLIFRAAKKVNGDDYVGRRILRLARHDISYYAMHTNFDVMGMADAAADEMKLKKRQVLDVTYEDEISKEGIGRFGKLPQIMSLRECAEYVKDCFGLEKVRVYGDLDMMIESAAISPGSGGSMIAAALEKKSDVLITGDIDYHEGCDAVLQGLAIIDADHYGLEKLFMPYIKEYLGRELKELTVYTQNEKLPFYYV